MRERTKDKDKQQINRRRTERRTIGPTNRFATDRERNLMQNQGISPHNSNGQFCRQHDSYGGSLVGCERFCKERWP
jgi:hypothetical protein